MPLQQYEYIYDINCLIFHDIQFNGKSKLLIDSVSHISYSNPIAIKDLTVDSDLNFRQLLPLSAVAGFRVPFVADPLLPNDLSSLYTGAERVSIKTILKKYASRNC